jgi:hypothetical protein
MTSIARCCSLSVGEWTRWKFANAWFYMTNFDVLRRSSDIRASYVTSLSFCTLSMVQTAYYVWIAECVADVGDADYYLDISVGHIR